MRKAVDNASDLRRQVNDELELCDRLIERCQKLCTQLIAQPDDESIIRALEVVQVNISGSQKAIARLHRQLLDSQLCLTVGEYRNGRIRHV